MKNMWKIWAFLEVLVLLSRMYSFLYSLYSLYSFGCVCLVFPSVNPEIWHFSFTFSLIYVNYLAHSCTTFIMITVMTSSYVNVYVIHVKNRFCTMWQLWCHILKSLTLNKKAIWPPLFKMWDLVTEKWWIIAIKCNFVDFKTKTEVCMDFSHIWQATALSLGIIPGICPRLSVQAGSCRQSVGDWLLLGSYHSYSPVILHTGSQDFLLRSSSGLVVVDCASCDLEPPEVRAPIGW